MQKLADHRYRKAKLSGVTDKSQALQVRVDVGPVASPGAGRRRQESFPLVPAYGGGLYASRARKVADGECFRHALEMET